MMMLLLAAALAAEPECKWCVADRPEIVKEVVALANMAPAKLLKAVRAKGVCVKIMDSRRSVPPKTFYWGQVEKPKDPLNSTTKIAGLMGKSMCKDEQPIAQGCPTIVLASDAPYSTIIHEYLHHLQSKRHKEWCSLSKELWIRPPNEHDWRMIRDKEWDVHRFLWNNRSKMKLEVDDHIAIVSETINEAEQRKRFDPEAKAFLEKSKALEQLNRLMDEYGRRQAEARKKK